MELVLKLPKDKPPFIGLLFENEYLAARTNAGWVNNYRTCDYSLRLEVTGTTLNIEMVCTTMQFNHVYEDVKFDPDKLYKFMYMTKQTPLFNFSHVFKKFNDLEVVRTSANMTLFVLKVKKLEVLFDL